MNHDVLHCIMSKHALTNVNHEKQLVDGYCHSMIFSSKNNNMHFMKKSGNISMFSDASRMIRHWTTG